MQHLAGLQCQAYMQGAIFRGFRVLREFAPQTYANDMLSQIEVSEEPRPSSWRRHTCQNGRDSPPLLVKTVHRAGVEELDKLDLARCQTRRVRVEQLHESVSVTSICKCAGEEVF